KRFSAKIVFTPTNSSNAGRLIRCRTSPRNTTFRNKPLSRFTICRRRRKRKPRKCGKTRPCPLSSARRPWMQFAMKPQKQSATFSARPPRKITSKKRLGSKRCDDFRDEMFVGLGAGKRFFVTSRSGFVIEVKQTFYETEFNPDAGEMF